MKKDPHNPGQMLPMGFGFVEYRFQQHAKEALKTLQGKELDTHALQLKLSSKSSANEKGERKVAVLPVADHV